MHIKDEENKIIDICVNRSDIEQVLIENNKLHFQKACKTKVY